MEEPIKQLFKQLTVSGRMGRRSKELLRDPEDPSISNWYMYVPTAFNDALDIKFESEGPNVGWTQSGRFSFRTADTLYNTEQAYEMWSTGLTEISIAVVVTGATSAGVGSEGKRNPGNVDFEVLIPNRNKSKLTTAFEWNLSQDSFVEFLIDGPSNELDDKLRQAKENQTL